MDRKPLDLRGDERSMERDQDPSNGLMIAGVLLIIGGILIALIVPTLTSGDNGDAQTADRTPLSIVLSSTISELETEDHQYSYISIPQSYYTLMQDGITNLSIVDGVVQDMLKFMLGDDTPFELKISTGSGWEDKISHSVIHSSFQGEVEEVQQMVIVDTQGEEQVTMNFDLKIGRLN
jgi:hypothetical protein